jgi:anti-anti-sigma factor
MHAHLFTRVSNDAALVTLAVPHLDDSTTHSVKDRLTDLADRVGPKELHLDFAAVESMGSTAMAMLVSINRKMAIGKGHLVLVNVADHLVELFKLTRLDTLIDIRPTRTGELAPTGAGIARRSA